MGKLSRAKGAAFERHVAIRFREVYPGAKRGLGQARTGHEVDDVEGTPFWIQCKHEKRPNIFAALEQAERDTQRSGSFKRPIVVARKNGGADIAALGLMDFLKLLVELEEAKAELKRLADERLIESATKPRWPNGGPDPLG